MLVELEVQGIDHVWKYPPYCLLLGGPGDGGGVGDGGGAGDGDGLGDGVGDGDGDGDGGGDGLGDGLGLGPGVLPHSTSSGKLHACNLLSNSRPVGHGL